MTQTKADVIRKIQDVNPDIKKGDVTRVVNATFDNIIENYKNLEDTRINGFGNFEVHTRKARKGRNPQTGKEMEIPESLRAAFRPGKVAKEAVREAQNNM